jgi:hypothetical protein
VRDEETAVPLALRCSDHAHTQVTGVGNPATLGRFSNWFARSRAGPATALLHL